MFGPRVRFGIAFKDGQKNFTIFKRKCFHNFKVQVDGKNWEGVSGMDLPDLNAYALADDLTIGIYDQITFRPI